MAIAAHLQAEEGVDGWWAQSLTVGYERITGLRQRHQQPDGTFAVSASRTVTADAVELRRQLLDPAARARLFPGHTTDLRSRPTAKNVRLGLDPGTAEIAIMAKADGRITVAVQHSRLPDAGDVARWRTFWSGWLDGIERPGGLAD